MARASEQTDTDAALVSAASVSRGVTMTMIARFAATAALVLLPGAAYAQSETIGEKLRSISQELWSPFLFLIACVSFAAGLALLAMGLLKLARQNETREGIWKSGLSHIVAATLLISLPDAAGAGLITVFSEAASGGASALAGLELDADGGASITSGLVGGVTGMANVGSVQNCLTSSTPATCMARNIAVNAIPMAIWTLFGMTFLLGLIGFASAIFDITRSQGQGGLPKGWSTKVVTSILLMNGATLFTMATSTVLGRQDGPINEQGLNSGSSMLSYPANSSISIVQQYAEMIGHCFTILAFFGAWAFIRGIFLVKAAAEGRTQSGSYGMSAVFIVAGILLANAKYSACVALTTMGGEAMGQGFCG